MSRSNQWRSLSIWLILINCWRVVRACTRCSYVRTLTRELSPTPWRTYILRKRTRSWVKSGRFVNGLGFSTKSLAKRIRIMIIDKLIYQLRCRIIEGATSSSPIQPPGLSLKDAKLYLWCLAAFSSLKCFELNSRKSGFKSEKWYVPRGPMMRVVPFDSMRPPVAENSNCSSKIINSRQPQYVLTPPRRAIETS